jgi:hypothetical protein
VRQETSLGWLPVLDAYHLAAGPKVYFGTDGQAPQKYTSPLRTCRQIYDEARLPIYELNAFTFRNSISLRMWLSSRLPIQCSIIHTFTLPIDIASSYVENGQFLLKHRFPSMETVFLTS